MRETKRKAFNFLRSYFDVLNELKTDEDKLSFLLSIIDKQFLNEDPEGLSFLANLCYQSQRHQIESSVKGWERASNDTLSTAPPTAPPTAKGSSPPTTPKEVEEKGEEEVQGEVQVHRKFDHLTISIVEYDKLCKEWTTEQADEIIDNIENYKNNTNYKSLYLTARKWLKKQHPKQDDALSKIDELKKHY